MSLNNIGLCKDCIFSKIIKTKTSVFYMCTNKKLIKYPRLPKKECNEYKIFK
jgi:hypothetical protein